MIKSSTNILTPEIGWRRTENLISQFIGRFTFVILAITLAFAPYGKSLNRTVASARSGANAKVPSRKYSVGCSGSAVASTSRVPSRGRSRCRVWLPPPRWLLVARADEQVGFAVENIDAYLQVFSTEIFPISLRAELQNPFCSELLIHQGSARPLLQLDALVAAVNRSAPASPSAKEP